VPEARTFLLEIGCEEIPAPMIPKALDDLANGILEALGPLAASASAERNLGGPRRLVARLSGLAAREEDREETVTGPPRAAAYDAEGKPTKAALGFAKGQGVEVSDLRLVPGAKGEVLAATRKIRGRTALDLLASSIPSVLGAMRFGKMMRWGDRGYSFVRPVKWILALLDDEVVPFEFMGVGSGRTTRGHRFLGPGPHEVASASGYEATLQSKGRIVCRIDERRRILLDLAAAEARAAGGRIRSDPDLIEELIFLTEHPAVARGSFAEAFLSLPEPVLHTTMRHHQKYMTIEGDDGRLRNGFVAVLTTDNDAEGRIRLGNEWVLRARLADAKFFYEEDLRKPLEERLADLSRVTFHARLGSYADKVERMRKLAATIGGAMRLDAEDLADAEKAVLLMKADLTTGMVGEFPELQGIMGGIYARRQGIGEGCARAIETHYLPVSVEGPVPAGGAPSVAALADKADTLAVCFSAGLIPKGSADPYALRRAAQGILRTIVENEIRLDLDPILDAALALAAEAGFTAASRARGSKDGEKKREERGHADPRPALAEFLSSRLRFLMEEAGIRFDAARAVLAAGWSDPLRSWRRAHALNALRGQDDFLALAAAAKRVRNILAQAAEKGIRIAGPRAETSRLQAGSESDLHAAMSRARADAERLASGDDYRGALSAVASLRPAVDVFFDKVLVMDKDESIRANRLALLSELSALLSRDADFAEIVVEGEAPAESASTRSGR